MSSSFTPHVQKVMSQWDNRRLRPGSQRTVKFNYTTSRSIPNIESQIGPFDHNTVFSMKVVAFRQIPTTTSSIIQERIKEGYVYAAHNAPDIDNTSRAIINAVFSKLSLDDRRIFKLEVEKYFSNNPRVEVEITAH